MTGAYEKHNREGNQIRPAAQCTEEADTPVEPRERPMPLIGNSGDGRALRRRTFYQRLAAPKHGGERCICHQPVPISARSLRNSASVVAKSRVRSRRLRRSRIAATKPSSR